MKSNPIVAANWDQSLTLTQNYRRLGLSSKLNSSSGGTEAVLASTPGSGEKVVTGVGRDALVIVGHQREMKEGEVGSVKVVRDAKGNITGVIRDADKEEEKRRRNPLGDPLTELEDQGDTERVNMMGRGTGIIPELEEASRFEKKKIPRKQSQREVEWVRKLVERWGNDFSGMRRDRRLNPMQQSEGDLRRRVDQWRKSSRKDEGEEGIDVG